VNCPKKSATVDSNFDTWSVGNRYKLCRLLGRGSYGVVAEAIDKIFLIKKRVPNECAEKLEFCEALNILTQSDC
jgi:hypothetical protein